MQESRLNKNDKKLSRQIEVMDVLERQIKAETKKEQQAVEQRTQAEIEERERQVSIGVVEKPANVGRFKYKMRKTDF